MGCCEQSEKMFPLDVVYRLQFLTFLEKWCWLGWQLGTLQRSLSFILWLNGCLDLWTCCHIFFIGGTTETLAGAPCALAFGGTCVIIFFISFFFAAIGVAVSFNLELVGNLIIPSSFNNFKFGIVKFGFPFPS
jgi:hypothetical protein